MDEKNKKVHTYMHTYAHTCTLQGRTVRLEGTRQNPVRLVDEKNKEVLWDRERNLRLANPWAKAAFSYRLSGNGFVVSVCVYMCAAHAEHVEHASNSSHIHVYPFYCSCESVGESCI